MGNMFASLGLASQAMLGRKVSEGVNRKTAAKLLETEGVKIQQTLREIDKLIGIPKNFKLAMLKSPIQTTRFFLDNPVAANKFRELATAVLVGIKGPDFIESDRFRGLTTSFEAQ